MPSLIRITTFLLLLSAAVGHAEPNIKVSVDKVGDGFVVETVAVFPVSVRVAWEVLTDFDNMATILSNLTSSKIVRRNGNTLRVMQEGAARYGLFSYDFSSEREIRLDPPKRIVSHQLSGNARRFDSDARLQGTEQGAELRYHAEMVPDSSIARMFGGSFVRHEIEEQLIAMSAEMEKRDRQQ